MANQIRLKRASGSDPGASDLVTGEIAVRTDTGKLFTKKDDNSVTEIGVTAVADGSITSAKIADGAIVNADVNASAAIAGSKIDPDFGSQNIDTTGYIQITSATPSLFLTDSDNNPDYIVRNNNGTFVIRDGTVGADRLQIATDGHVDVTGNLDVGAGVDVTGDISVSGTVDGRDLATDGTKLDGIESGATADQSASDIKTLLNSSGLANAQIDASAAIAGTKISPDFGSQNIVTTGTLGSGDITITGGQPAINFIDSGQNPDYILYNNNGALRIHDSTNGADRFVINTDGHVDIAGNVDFGAGLDVTGNITVTGTVDGRDLATDGSKLDGIAASATNVTNNNQLTNGAGYITSADGGNAATLDSIDSSQFLRSDTGDTASGLLTISGGMTFASDTKCTANIASLTDGSTITINFTTGIHHAVTLGGNRTLAANNEGSAVGQCGSIFITQDGTGSRTLSYSSDYKFVGGTAPTLSTAANAVDRIDYVIRGDGVVHCAISLDVK